MILLLNHLLLALAWVAVTGTFSLANLVLGLILAAAALYLIRERVNWPNFFLRARRIVALALLFLYELILSALRVALLVVSPKMKINPGIIAFPLTVQRDFEITLLANLITLTPGTLSVDVSDDKATLYVHCVDASDPDQTRRDIAEGFERKIIEAFQ